MGEASNVNAELEQYANQLTRLLERVAHEVEQLSVAELNWRPPAPETSSVYVIASHIVGMLEAWVLGMAAEHEVVRDREAEFSSSGVEPAALAEAARELSGRVQAALSLLPPEALDAARSPDPTLWGTGTARPIAVRQLLALSSGHAYTHLGHLEITRDLAITAKAR